MKHKLRVALGALAGLALVGGGLVTLNSPAEVSPEVTPVAKALPSQLGVLTWNICGAITKCPNHDNPAAKISQLTAKLKQDKNIGVIMLQEACLMHADLLGKALRDLKQDWVVHHRKASDMSTDRPLKCAADKTSPEERRYTGSVIAMRMLRGGNPQPHQLEVPAIDNRPQTQGAACLKDTTNKILACTVHFPHDGADADPKGTYRAAMAKYLHGESVKLQRAKYRTIIGGDFNETPESSRIKVMYADHFEADSRHKRTTNSSGKIDYVFFSDYGWDLVGANVYGGGAYNGRPLSDHWMLKGTVKPSS